MTFCLSQASGSRLCQIAPMGRTQQPQPNNNIACDIAAALC
jgi:hypothetical protein